MSRILLTGATGTVGTEVVKSLQATGADNFSLGVRAINEAKNYFAPADELTYCAFDFENEQLQQKAFAGVDTLFLLRPPHLSDVKKTFEPLLEIAQSVGVRNIIFLSVQGVENSKVIPHHKIEQLIQQLNFNYVFVRPSYFMQNLTGDLLPEIRQKQSITLPSEEAKFNWIDAKDIGEAIATILSDFDRYRNRAFTITGTENKNFRQVAQLISEELGTTVRYKRVHPLHFLFLKVSSGTAASKALVMTVLHYLPRFQQPPKVAHDFQQLTGRTPTTLEAFLKREKAKFLPLLP